MQPIPLVASSSLHPLVAFRAHAVGSNSSYRSAGGVVPLVFAGRMFEDLAREMGAEDAGLRVGAAARFEDSPLGRHVAGSYTVGAALRRAARSGARYCGGQQIWLIERGDHVWLQRLHANTLRRGRRQANDFALRLLVDLVRRAAGPSWRPAELYLEGPPPGHAEELAALAEHSTHFGAAADRLVFPRSVLALPLPRAGGSAGATAPPLPGFDFVQSVRLAIRFLLEAGDLTLGSVAETAGRSPRSLQRHLAESGFAFFRLVDEARFEAASHMLRDDSIRIADVASILGYGDAANFTRAFRRWTGVSPLEFRRTAGQEPLVSRAIPG